MAVIGAGPAGLAAAHALRERGLQVRVLEATDRVGGKLRSSRREGFLLDEGAYFLPTTHRGLLALAGRARFADQVVPGGFVLATARNGSIHTIRGDHVLADVARTALLSARSKARAARLAAEVVRARNANFDRIDRTNGYDRETVDAWAARELNGELREYVTGATMRAIFAAEADQCSRVDFLGLIALFKGARLVAFRGGMGSFAERLGAGLDVELGAEALEVLERRDTVTVTWRAASGGERSGEFAGCVLAIAAQHAVRVRAGLDRWRAEYLGRVRNGRLLIANVALSVRPPGLDVTYLQVPRSAHPFLAGVAFDHHKAPGRTPAGKGLVTLTGINRWSETHYEDPDDDIVKALTQALATVLPGTEDAIEFVAVQRWAQQYNPVGHYRDLGRFRAISDRADRLVQLAGEYHSSPNLEAAVRSGERAAGQLAAALT